MRRSCCLQQSYSVPVAGKTCDHLILIIYFPVIFARIHYV